MKKMLAVLCLAAALPVLAEESKAPAQAPDLSKMGPWSRKANEAAVKKEINAFLAQVDAAEKKGTLEAQMALIDFPVFMVTDAGPGKVEAQEWSREKWEKEMKPFFENMPKDTKSTHKRTVSVLSDSLVQATDDFTMTMGKQKMSGRNTSLLVKRGSEWKIKTMVEAGWGGGEPEKK